MSGDHASGAGWTADLIFSPKKQKAYEDRLGTDSPIRFDHRINEVLQRTPPQPREIPDSDSEDEDDDEEFPDLFAKPSANAAAKRLARKTTGSSPSSIEANPEKRWAQFQALIDDAKEANELDQLQESAASEVDEKPGHERADKLEGRALYGQAVDIVRDAASGDDSDTEQRFTRVRQAMDRQSAAHTTPYYYFFAPVNDGSSAPGTPSRTRRGSPKAANADGELELAVQSKLATKFMKEPGRDYPDIDLPDELIIWILDVFPTEKSEAAREEFLQILEKQEPQVRRLFKGKQLERMFLDVGAEEDAVSLGRNGRVEGQRAASKNSRDWTPVYNILQLLRRCCGILDVNAQIHAVLLLLRASMDGEVRLQANIATAIIDTLVALISTVPSPQREMFVSSPYSSLRCRQI